MRTTFTAILVLAFAAVGYTAPVSDSSTSGGVVRYTHCNRPGVYALTFDDGPFEYSWDLAKLLNSRGVKATFFTNGHNYFTTNFNTTTTSTKSDGPKTYTEVLQLYNQLGHEIGSHTYEHKNLAGLSTAQVEYQMNTQSDLIFNAIGKR
jgi:peptidoglycan/xylan/chitin deacetylase (PgdA/CDA1 family)